MSSLFNSDLMTAYCRSFDAVFSGNWLLETNAPRDKVRAFYRANKLMIDSVVGPVDAPDENDPGYALDVFALARSTHMRILRTLRLAAQCWLVVPTEM